jgi:hypothetical protein
MEQFQVDKAHIETYRVASTKSNTTPQGHIVFEVERFAFTANNLTYYMVGEKLGYWQFFPPIDASKESNMGVIPVWGVGRVVASNSEEVPVGRRYFGYFPPASHLVMSNISLSNNNLIDASAHRLPLPQGYNMYRPLPVISAQASAQERVKQRIEENLKMLLWPLFATSFCLAEVINAIDAVKKEQVLILSGSSKTSLGLAYALNKSDSSVIGITSPNRIDTLSGMNVYSEVLTYDELNEIALIPTVIIDMSGNAKVKQRLKNVLGAKLTRYINVGLTHWQDAKEENDEDEFFFAPAHIQQRMREVGAQTYQKLSAEFIYKAMVWSQGWLKVQEQEGLAALYRDFPQHCQGGIPADTGMIYTLVSNQ